MSAAAEFSVPAWLADASDPVIDRMLVDLGADWQQLYLACLAEEVRGERGDAIVSRAWHAFARTGEMIRRRNMGERP